MGHAEDLIVVETKIGGAQGWRLWEAMRKQGQGRDTIEIGMPSYPRRQQLIGAGSECYRQLPRGLKVMRRWLPHQSPAPITRQLRP
ncbi:MAG: hypothetical protein BGO05_07765 [Rhizobiales bacterium 63-7]|nr:MAG: hypothetical protein BGO05_07765 [Rhizobiales bacterium 63-7]